MASSERDEQRRRSFREYVRGIVADRFVFVDE
jgi:transposase